MRYTIRDWWETHWSADLIAMVISIAFLASIVVGIFMVIMGIFSLFSKILG